MAYGTRGKIKEHLDGVHRNCNWITDHSIQCLELIKGDNPKLSEAFKALAELSRQVDKLAQGIYSTI